MPDQSIVF